ncbi:hypothetical protein K4K51_005170 [Colletotrichum sp. SAR 10_75]|nr:hypothetical protein K4K51_005170 [Colletotrichum sp. SAR 10_75]
MPTLRPRSSAPVVRRDTDMTDHDDRLHAASVRQDTPIGDPPIKTHDQSHDADRQLNVDIEKLDTLLLDTDLDTLGRELQTIFRRYQSTHSRPQIIRRLPQAVRRILVVANTGKKFRQLVDSVALHDQHSSGNPPAPAAQADAPHPYTSAQAAKSTSEVESDSQPFSVARPENDHPIPSKGGRAFSNDFGAPQAVSEDLPDLAHFPEHPVDFGPLVEVAANTHTEESADDSVDVESGRRQERFVEHDYVVDEDSLAEFPETQTPLRTIKDKTPILNHVFSPANFRFDFQEDADDSSPSIILGDRILPQAVVDQMMSSPSPSPVEHMASQADAGASCLVNMDDAATLAPETCLSSDVMNLCMSVMHGALRADTFTLLSTYCIVSTHTDHWDDATTPTKGYLVPLHLEEDKHWVLMHVNPNGTSVDVFDSLMSNLQTWRQNIVKRVNELEQTHLRTRMQSQPMLRFADCPQQDNGFDCGIFVLRRVFVALVSALSDNDESQESAWVLHKDLDVVEAAPAYDYPGPRQGTTVTFAEWSAGAPARKAWEEDMWSQQEQRILRNVEQLTLYETSVKAAHKAISELLAMRHTSDVAREKRDLTTELAQRRQISDMIQGLKFRTETETQCGKQQLRYLRRARRRLQDIHRSSTGFQSVQKQLEVEKEDVARRIETLRRMNRAQR